MPEVTYINFSDYTFLGSCSNGDICLVDQISPSSGREEVLPVGHIRAVLKSKPIVFALDGNSLNCFVHTQEPVNKARSLMAFRLCVLG